MPRNPKCDLVHAHNGLLGHISMAMAGMRAVESSTSTSRAAKDRAIQAWGILNELYEEVKYNPQY